MEFNASLKALAAGIVMLGFLGCATPLKKAPVGDRYQNLINASQLTQSRTQIDHSRSKVLAVVLSMNTQTSLAFNAELQQRFKSFSGAMTLNHEAIHDDVDIVLSQDGLMGALLAPLKARFKEVRLVNHIPEGFESGADYVAILDLDLNYLSLDSEWEPSSILHIDHTANCSVIFIDGELVAGPDIVANVLYKQETPARFADANNRDFIFAVKQARTTLIKLFEQKVNTSVLP